MNSLTRTHPLLRAASLWLTLLACAAPLHAKPSFTVKPPPAWVQTLDAGATTKDAPNADAASRGVKYQLLDRQYRVTAGGTERYFHFAKQVLSAAGLEAAAQLRLDFEPTYERLVIHHISLRRGGEVIDALRPGEIKIIQQENELNEQLYNGTLSAVAFLSDVRQGDVIDYAYSVNGDNPVLGGRYADAFSLGAGEPADYIHARLLWPAGRQLYLRNHATDAQPVVTPRGAEVEYVWERRAVPGFDYEGDTPAWFDALPTVRASEFAGWCDVVRWALPLYRVPPTIAAPALRAQIARWRTELPDPEARLLAARRFVQDDVRYLGIELGTYSHTPTQPDKVFARRFGDCKDKSLLLATLLRALDIEADPALVNTDERHTLDDWQPTPYAFDHVIVRANLGGHTYWIDPTISYQRGGLAEAVTPGYERALVLRDGTEALETIPAPQKPQPTTSVHETYSVKSFDAPVAVEIVTTQRGADADATRYRFASQSRAEIGKDYLNYYAQSEPAIEARGLPEVRDDERANVLIVTERYTIPHLWKDGAHLFLADRVSEELSKPDVPRRATPLRVSYPLNLEQLIDIELPEPLYVRDESRTVADDALRFDYRVANEGNTIRLRYALATKRDHVEPKQVAQHLATIEQARDLAGYELRHGEGYGYGIGASGARSSSGGGRGSIALRMLLLFSLLGGSLYLWQRAKHGRPFVPAFAGVGGARVSTTSSLAPPGAEPATAIRLRAASDLDQYLARAECPRCGQRANDAIAADATRQAVLYDGQRLLVAQFECAHCRHPRALYFAPTA